MMKKLIGLFLAVAMAIASSVDASPRSCEIYGKKVSSYVLSVVTGAAITTGTTLLGCAVVGFVKAYKVYTKALLDDKKIIGKKSTITFMQALKNEFSNNKKAYLLALAIAAVIGGAAGATIHALGGVDKLKEMIFQSEKNDVKKEEYYKGAVTQTLKPFQDEWDNGHKGTSTKEIREDAVKQGFLTEEEISKIIGYDCRSDGEEKIDDDEYTKQKISFFYAVKKLIEQKPFFQNKDEAYKQYKSDGRMYSVKLWLAYVWKDVPGTTGEKFGAFGYGMSNGGEFHGEQSENL